MGKDIIETIDSLKNLDTPRPVDLEQIEEAQKILGLKFAEDYIQLLLKYGYLGADGIELMGLSFEKYLNVVQNTLFERECDKTAPTNMYIIENLGIDGLLTWQDESGAVYGKMRYDDEIEKLADSLAEYIVDVIEEYYADEDDEC